MSKSKTNPTPQSRRDWPIAWENIDMDREHGTMEACVFVQNLDFEPSKVAFDAAFDK